MSVTPFAPPRSDSDPALSSPSRRTGWKVYAFAVAVAQVLGLFFALPKLGVAEALDYAVTAVGLSGLFGYAFRRPWLGRRIWRVLSVLIPLWDVVMGVWIYPSQSGNGVDTAYFLAMLLFLPQYLALVRYAYTSHDLWQP